MLSTLSLAIVTSVATLSGQTQPSVQQTPEALNQLLACRSTTDSAARLACYDGAVSALDSARRQGDLVVVDRAQVEETRREAFGFGGLAPTRLFGGAPAEDVQSIETTLQSASQTSNGAWVFRLADGSVWRQVDTEAVRFRNRPDQPVRVRKAALGSFLLTVGDSGAVRVRRQ